MGSMEEVDEVSEPESESECDELVLLRDWEVRDSLPSSQSL